MTTTPSTIQTTRLVRRIFTLFAERWRVGNGAVGSGFGGITNQHYVPLVRESDGSAPSYPMAELGPGLGGRHSSVLSDEGTLYVEAVKRAPRLAVMPVSRPEGITAG